MTREEFYDYIYSSVKEQLSDCLKESEIILTKDMIDGKESTYLALHTSENGFAPAFDLDGYYDQYMEEDSVDEFLETIVYVARQHAKFMKETNYMSMENYEEVKDRIRLRPAEGGTRIIREGREKREPVPRKSMSRRSSRISRVCSMWIFIIVTDGASAFRLKKSILKSGAGRKRICSQQR